MFSLACVVILSEAKNLYSRRSRVLRVMRFFASLRMTGECNTSGFLGMTGPDPKIAAVLIVRDEEGRLGDCLAPLAGVVDEIVVVDTGSRDGTRAIARGFTERVFSFTWADDFAAARNFALGCARGDYVLQIDADERLIGPEHARERLDAFIRTYGPRVAGTVAVHSPFRLGEDGPEQVGVEPLVRFFHRASFRYEGAIHEQVVPVSGTASAAATGLAFRHAGYALPPEERRTRNERNRRILEAELVRSPDDPYLHYQLGRTYFAERDHARAMACFERAARCVERGAGGLASRILADLVVSLAYCYANLGQLEAARRLLEAKLAEWPAMGGTPDVPHALGYVYLMLGDVARSKRAYESALKLGACGEIVLGTGSFSALYHLGLLAEAGGDRSAAVERYTAALRLNPDYAPARARLAELTTGAQRHSSN